MFCPECGTLGFIQPDDSIRCTDYKCGYEGPAGGSDGKGAEFIDPMTGETIDLSKTTAKSSATSLKHLTEVVEEEVARGTLWVGDYLCPKCDEDRIFIVLMQTRSSDEPETKISTCEGCGHKFREYQ